MTTRRRTKLRLHRQTMRVLSGPQLAAIAGGTGEIGPTMIDDDGSLVGPAPKTNAWSGIVAYQSWQDAQAICADPRGG